MLGRGMVADPGLALAIAAASPNVANERTAAESSGGVGWAALLPLVQLYWHRLAGHVEPKHRAGRLKQWLNLLRRRFPEAQALFDVVRDSNDDIIVGQRLQRDVCDVAPVALVEGVA